MCDGVPILAWIVLNVRRRSCKVHPGTSSSSSFLYLLHPDRGRSSETRDGKSKSVLLRRGTVSIISATIGPYGKVCSFEFFVAHSGSVIVRSFSSTHDHRRFPISPLRWPVSISSWTIVP